VTTTKKRLLTRYVWFLVALVILSVGAAAYSTFISERAVRGDIFDEISHESLAQDSWAFTQALHIACGGAFVVGTLVLTAAWFRE